MPETIEPVVTVRLDARYHGTAPGEGDADADRLREGDILGLTLALGETLGLTDGDTEGDTLALPGKRKTMS